MKSPLIAFEEHIRSDPIMGIEPKHFLKKLESKDINNPEYVNRLIDDQWQVWLKAWASCVESMNQTP